MLKRHLRTSYNLSPEQYRRRWGLPTDYPMVASKYAERRSALAKKIGLGRQRRAEPPPAPPIPIRPGTQVFPAEEAAAVKAVAGLFA